MLQLFCPNYFLFLRAKTSNGIALTFDDGPHRQNTPIILDILKTRKIKATFFLLGTEVEKFPDMARHIIEQGHEIGNHSYDHINIKKAGFREITKSCLRVQHLFREIGWLSPIKLLRVPYGFLNFKALLLVCIYRYVIVHWSIDSKDSFIKETSGLRAYFDNQVFNYIKNGDILLFHDDYAQTIKALPYILDHLINDGFSFITVGEMLSQNNLNNGTTRKPNT